MANSTMPTCNEIHITYVDTEGPLIKLFAQVDNNASALEKLFYKMSTILEGDCAKPQLISDLQLGLICCAKFEDGKYYRAKIFNLDRLNENCVKVFFIDYGNRADVFVRDIRLISKLSILITNEKVKKILEYPNLALEFILGGVIANSEFDENILEFLRQHLNNSDMTCSISELGDKRVITKIIKAHIDPIICLVDSNKAIQVSIDIFKKFVQGNPQFPNNFNFPPPTAVDMTKQPPLTRIPNLTQPPPMRMATDMYQHTNQPVLSRVMNVPAIPGTLIRRPELPPPSKSLQFTTEMLPVGVTHAVYVSHVDDGPHSFTVQIQSEIQEFLIKMMTEMNSIEPVPIKSPLNPGSICLSRASTSDDQSLCRAVVMNVKGDKVQLYYTDFGNSEVVNYSDIYEIPPRFISPKVMSHRFALSNIKDVVYSEKQKLLFKNLVSRPNTNGVLQIKVMSAEANPLKRYCELFLNRKNIKAIMVEMEQSMPPLRYTTQQLPNKGTFQVVVPYVVSPAHFFIQLKNNTAELNEIMLKVAEHCLTASQIPLKDLRAGVPCCAMFEDGTWYRAEILKVLFDKLLIHFVDYGNQDDIELVNIRAITEELVMHTKPQALVCCLKGYEARCAAVSEEISNRFEELVLEKCLTMRVVEATEHQLIVELSDNGQDICTLLEALPGHATLIQATPSHTASSQISHPQIEEPSKPIVKRNTREDQIYSESRGPSDEGGQSWRAPPQGSNSRYKRGEGPPFEKRYNKDEESKPQNSVESRYNRGNKDDESKHWNGGEGRLNRGNKDDESKHWNGGEGRLNRGNKDDESKSWNSGEGRFNRGDSRSGRFTREEDGGGNKFGERKGRYIDDDKGGRFVNTESRERRNLADNDKPWKKRNDDGGGKWNNRDSDGGWKPRDGGSDGGRKPRDGGSDGGCKPRDGGNDGGRKPRDGGGDRRSKFNDDSDNRRGENNRDTWDRSDNKKPWERGSNDSYGKSSQKTVKADTFGGIPYSSVKVGVTESTQVVFSTSPFEFYVQLNSSADQLRELMEKISAACESGDAAHMETVEEKTACLAKFSEDEAWYRGYILEKSLAAAKVHFVDYGNKEDVPFDKIKMLPEDLSVLPVQAIKCRLYGIPEEQETAQMDTFELLTAEKNLQTQFVSKHFLTEAFQVLLVDEESSTNINIAMGAEEEEVLGAVSKNGIVTPSMPTYTAGVTLTVQIAWYKSPAEFYVQPMATNPEFRAMMQAMQCVSKTGKLRQTEQLNADDFVIARFKADKVLYRAFVKKTGYSPTVQYLDYGNTEAVDSGSVWDMEPEFAILPLQALKCSLAGVLPQGDAWPQANTTALDLHFEADTLDCTIIKATHNQYSVKLVKNGEDVAAKIIEASFAVADGYDAARELDATLLVGQLFAVTVLHVKDDLTFFIRPPARFESLESVAGEGIKCWLTEVREDASESQLTELKQLPSETSVIISVDTVHTDGLQVTLFNREGQLLPLQGSGVSTVERVCPLPLLNMHQSVVIAHASTEDGIFLHKTEFAEPLANLLKLLFEFYNSSEQSDQEWSVGEICVAKSNDEQWYRARILETGDEYKVQFIDYGNCENLPIFSLRKLDNSFYMPHAFAMKINFHVTWNVPVENLLELAVGTEYNAVILQTSEGFLAELVETSGHSLTDKLVELGFAVTLENSPFKRVVEGGRFVEGTDIVVSPTFIDSPTQMWVCVGDDIELVEALQDRLQEVAPKLSPLKELSGIFAAKYSDELWYRAIKLDESIARFIDYGNSDIVDMSDLKELSADFLEPAEGYAVKVKLPVTDIKKGATERLNSLLLSEDTELDGEIMAHVISVKESYIVADITKGGKSVVDILVSENLCTRIQPGFISHMNSLDDFFIQLAGRDSLETMNNIMLAAESFEPVTETKLGDLVAALYSEDKAWYRAKIIGEAEDGKNVLFIDYGNSSVAKDFRLLPSDLVSMPPLSIHCALKIPIGVAEWSDAAYDKFVEMAADGYTHFDFKLLNSEDPATVIISYNGNCVSEELKILCNFKECVSCDKSITNTASYGIAVYISHFNSTTDFYVHKDGVEVELDAIKEELAKASSFEEVQEITDDIKNTILGAFFSEDQSWYRAKIIDILDNEINALFIDYGNTAVTTKLIKLPESLANKSPIATHCALGKKIRSEAENNHFVALASDGNAQFQMNILEEGEPLIVSLITENRIVEDELDLIANESSDVSIESIEVKKETGCFSIHDEGVLKTVYIIQANSPDNFFMHTAEATQQVSSISEHLAEAEGFPQVEISSVTEGEILAAQFDEDDLWYRAKIISKSDTETKVLFIDYGNMANVAKLKRLPIDLASTPASAMHCSLQKPENSEWSTTALETFNKLSNDESLTFKLKMISNSEEGSMIVDLFVNGDSITQQLVLDANKMCEHELNKEETIENSVIDVDCSKTSSSLDISKVEISHYNSPNDFFVQCLGIKDELYEITENLSEAENFEAMLDIDEILAAKYSVDELWYRAKVLDTNLSGSTVLFVDYGNTDIVNEFRKLPKHLAEKKPLAKHCCIHTPQGPLNDDSCAKLSALATEGHTFEMKVIEEADPFVIELYLNDRSIVEMVVNPNDYKTSYVVGKENSNDEKDESRCIPDESIVDAEDHSKDGKEKSSCETDQFVLFAGENVYTGSKDRKEESCYKPDESKLDAEEDSKDGKEESSCIPDESIVDAEDHSKDGKEKSSCETDKFVLFAGENLYTDSKDKKEEWCYKPDESVLDAEEDSNDGKEESSCIPDESIVDDEDGSKDGKDKSSCKTDQSVLFAGENLHTGSKDKKEESCYKRDKSVLDAEDGSKDGKGESSCEPDQSLMFAGENLHTGSKDKMKESCNKAEESVLDAEEDNKNGKKESSCEPDQSVLFAGENLDTGSTNKKEESCYRPDESVLDDEEVSKDGKEEPSYKIDQLVLDAGEEKENMKEELNPKYDQSVLHVKAANKDEKEDSICKPETGLDTDKDKESKKDYCETHITNDTISKVVEMLEENYITETMSDLTFKSTNSGEKLVMELQRKEEGDKSIKEGGAYEEPKLTMDDLNPREKQICAFSQSSVTGAVSSIAEEIIKKIEEDTTIDNASTLVTKYCDASDVINDVLDTKHDLKTVTTNSSNIAINVGDKEDEGDCKLSVKFTNGTREGDCITPPKYVKQRSNIDEQIVPGCISATPPE